jgi:hypothetical protein
VKLGLSGSTAILDLHGQQLVEQRELMREQIFYHQKNLEVLISTTIYAVNSVVENGKRNTARIYPINEDMICRLGEALRKQL